MWKRSAFLTVLCVFTACGGSDSGNDDPGANATGGGSASAGATAGSNTTTDGSGTDGSTAADGSTASDVSTSGLDGSEGLAAANGLDVSDDSGDSDGSGATSGLDVNDGSDNSGGSSGTNGLDVSDDSGDSDGSGASSGLDVNDGSDSSVGLDVSSGIDESDATDSFDADDDGEVDSIDATDGGTTGGNTDSTDSSDGTGSTDGADSADSVDECESLCQPGWECGADGCGGNCGICAPGLKCISGSCEEKGIEIVVAGGHSCVLYQGIVTCYGAIGLWSSGQPKNVGQVAVPSSLTTKTVTNVAVGPGISCAYTADEEWLCWGDDQYGVGVQPPVALVDVEVGAGHACGLTASGFLYCWGAEYTFDDGTSGNVGQLDFPAGIYENFSLGSAHSCGITLEDELICIGANTDTLDVGQTIVPAGSYISVAAGSYHTCAIRTDKSVGCWGLNDYGQTDAPTGTFESLSAGRYHTCGIRTDGAIACWGYIGDTLPDVIPGGFNFASVHSQWVQTIAVRTDNTLACFDIWKDNTPPAPMSEYGCPCGDGMCQDFENEASCPEDCGSGGGPANCQVTVSVTSGEYPSEISWKILQSGITVWSGNAPTTEIVDLEPGSTYIFEMSDSYGDGWNGAVYSVESGSTTLSTGTLSSGSIGSNTFFTPGVCANSGSSGSGSGGTNESTCVTETGCPECFSGWSCQYKTSPNGSFVTDWGTSLDWELGGSGASNLMVFSEAESYCNSKGSGWRLPTRLEYQGLCGDDWTYPDGYWGTLLDVSTFDDWEIQQGYPYWTGDPNLPCCYWAFSPVSCDSYSHTCCPNPSNDPLEYGYVRCVRDSTETP